MSKNKALSVPVQPPKRALTAFFLYRQEVYDEVKKDNPEAKITEITKIIGEMWRNATQKTKDRLTKQYLKNKENYEEQKVGYEKRFGKIQVKKKRRQTK